MFLLCAVTFTRIQAMFQHTNLARCLATLSIQLLHWVCILFLSPLLLINFLNEYWKKVFEERQIRQFQNITVMVLAFWHTLSHSRHCQILHAIVMVTSSQLHRITTTQLFLNMISEHLRSSCLTPIRLNFKSVFENLEGGSTAYANLWWFCGTYLVRYDFNMGI